jgi:hypothetical protein
MEPTNRFQGINSASLCSLAGRYDNPIPTWCLALIDFFLKFQLWIRVKGRACILSTPAPGRYRTGQHLPRSLRLSPILIASCEVYREWAKAIFCRSVLQSCQILTELSGQSGTKIWPPGKTVRPLSNCKFYESIWLWEKQVSVHMSVKKVV